MADSGTLTSLAAGLPGIIQSLRSGDGSGAFTRALGSTVVRRVTFRSQFTPDLDLQPFAPGDPGAPASPLPGFVLGLVRPEIEIDTPLGLQVYAPYGRPVGSFLPHIGGAGALLVAGTALYLGSKALAKTAGLVGLGLIGYGVARQRGIL